MATICVFCSSSEQIDKRYAELATAVGAEIARRGHSLVSGGGSVSMMGAVARAARDGGAHTIGVIPDALAMLEVADGDADELVTTEDMRSRKAEMERRADAFLILPGGIGTLEELLEIWVARSLAMHDKPVVVLDPDGVFELLRAQVERLVETGFVRRKAVTAVDWCKSVDEAFELLSGGPDPEPPPTSGEVLEAEPPR